MDYASSSASGQQQEQERAPIESKVRVLWEKQTYVNLLYLLVSFPLGIFYTHFKEQSIQRGLIKRTVPTHNGPYTAALSSTL